jgi:gliding motility-associatede transport system auxiliary component
MKASKIQTTVGILLVVVILVLVNMIANTRFMRLDLTEDKLFSISDASKDVVENLDEPLTVKVFASKNLSPQLNDSKRFLNDLLAGYRAYGGGNFRYEFIDPGSDEELEAEAQNYRIPPFQENVWEKDELQLKKVYLGAVFLYNDKQETIPTLQGSAGLEYNITSLIKRLTNQQSYTVGFLQGHGEPDPEQQMQQPGMAAGGTSMAQVANVLKSNYAVESVNLAEAPTVPGNIDVLMIVGPTTPIPEAEQMKIDQFVMNGGEVGWLVSPITADLQNGTASAARLEMDEWTSNYGFRINSNLVADANSAMINVQERRGFFTIQNTIKYPFFPTVNTFNNDAIVIENIDLVSLFFPSSIDTTYASEHNINVTPVMYSGERTMVQAGTFSINATQEWADDMFDREHLVLGVMLEGPFKSKYAGMSSGEDIDIVGQAQTAPENTRMFVIGDGRFLQDAYLSNPANVYLMLNAVDWLVGDTDLIALRGREFTMRTLKDITTTQKQVWKYVNWFAPPLLAIFFGIVYWQIRRNRRYSEELS